MRTRSRTFRAAALVFASVLSGTILIPSIRPLFALLYPENEGAMHAFMAINMLGAILGAPLLASLADRFGHHRAWVASLSLIDGVLLFAAGLGIPLPLLFAVRFLQGAANVAGLSILLGAVQSDSSKNHGREYGLFGAAIIFAVAAGAPLGTLLLRVDPRTTLLAGGVLEFVVCAGTFLVAMAPHQRAAQASPFRLLREAPLLRLPVLWVSIERFAVGCFVVTFALYAHSALELGDQQIGGLYSWFLLPFAAATYPFGRIADRLPRSTLVASGLFLYALSFFAMGFAGKEALPLVLFLAGIASAAIYAPSLCYAASLAPRETKATAMSLLNAGGSLGMMLGTALAGIISSMLKQRGFGTNAYVVVFCVAGAVQLIALLISARGLSVLSEKDRGELALEGSAT